MSATRLTLAVGFFLLGATASWAADLPKKAEPERLKLWDLHAPNGDGTFEKAEAWVTVHKPDKPNGAAAVICPGVTPSPFSATSVALTRSGRLLTSSRSHQSRMLPTRVVTRSLSAACASAMAAACPSSHHCAPERYRATASRPG